MRRILVLFTTLFVVLGLAPVPAGAQTMATIGEELDKVGYWVDAGAESAMVDEDWEGVRVANANDIAYVALDQKYDTDANGQAIASELAAASNRYNSVVVLFTNGIWAWGSEGVANAASDAGVVNLFAGGNVGAGLQAIVDLTGGDVVTQPTTAIETPATTTPQQVTTTGTTDDNGGGFPWLWIFLAGVVTFFFVRWRSAKSKAAEQLKADMAADRAEVQELLKDRADQVIELGDRAIESGNDELIDLYESASRTYQDVSQRVDDAETPEAIDALDERIAEAAWQLDVIEATLDGQPLPPSPSELEAANATPPPPTSADRAARPNQRPSSGHDANDAPVLGANESILGHGPPSQRARTRRSRSQRTRSGGGIGGSLMTMLTMLLFNSYGNRSRRTQRRRVTTGGSSRRRASSASSLGRGSVLGGAPKRRN